MISRRGFVVGTVVSVALPSLTLPELWRTAATLWVNPDTHYALRHYCLAAEPRMILTTITVKFK